MTLTREQIADFATKHYGASWVAKLARAIGYNRSTVLRMSTGDIPVSRRMELEMEKLMRKKRFEFLAKPETRY